jgi:hypothetical protein
MKPLVGQLQTQRVLPVNPGAHGLRRLPVTEMFHELHDADQGQLPGMECRLPFAGVHGGEQLIVKERVQLIAQPEVDVAMGKGCVGDTRGFNWHGVQAISR